MFFTGPRGTPFKAGVMSWGLRTMGLEATKHIPRADLRLMRRLVPRQISLMQVRARAAPRASAEENLPAVGVLAVDFISTLD